MMVIKNRFSGQRPSGKKYCQDEFYTMIRTGVFSGDYLGEHKIAILATPLSSLGRYA